MGINKQMVVSQKGYKVPAFGLFPFFFMERGTAMDLIPDLLI